MTALIIFCLAKLRTSSTRIFQIICSQANLEKRISTLGLNVTCHTRTYALFQYTHKYTYTVCNIIEYNRWWYTEICDGWYFRQIPTGRIKSTDVLRVSIHLLRCHENKSERNIKCVVNKQLMMQTKQTIIMRILYYQCVNGVSFLSGY